MNWKTGLSIAVAVVLIGLLVVLTGPTKASLLLINGNIYQADGTPRTVEALAIRDGTDRGSWHHQRDHPPV